MSKQPATLVPIDKSEKNEATSAADIKGQVEAQLKLARGLTKTDPKAAIAHYEEALAIDPRNAFILNELGLQYKSTNEIAKKRALFEDAIKLKPDFAQAHNNLGITLVDDFRLPDEAIASFKQALALKANFPEAWTNLGYAYKYKGQLAEAKKALQKALAFSPNAYTAHINLSAVLCELGEFTEALKHTELAAALEPTMASPHVNASNIYVELGEIELAKQKAEHALSLENDSHVAKVNLAACQHLLGDWQNAWINYEGRWGIAKTSENVDTPMRPDLPQALWQGQAVCATQDSILVYSEQGFGDTINFMRYLPMVAARFHVVVFIVHPELYRLVRASLNPNIQVYPFEQANEILAKQHFDWQCPLLSLPRAFGTTLANVPQQMPYINVPFEHRYQPPTAHHTFRRLRVGLCHAGNPKLGKDKARSIPIALFEPLLSLPAIEWHNLCHEAQHIDARLKPALKYAGDFIDSAAVLEGLDLIITVDTAIAHLAGALNKPVWLLNRFVPDWRWGMQGESSVWYPSMRQFRQRRADDWQPVIQAASAALVQTLYNHAEGLLKRFPAQVDALHIKGICLAMQNNPLAQEVLLTAARNENGTGEMWVNLAKFMAGRGDKTSAIVYLKERLADAPDDALVQQLLAEINT